MLTPSAPWSLLAGLPTVRTLAAASASAQEVFSVRLGMVIIPRRDADGAWSAVCSACGVQIGLNALDVVTAPPVSDAAAAAPTFDTNPEVFVAAWRCSVWRNRELRSSVRDADAFAADSTLTGRVSVNPGNLRLLQRASSARTVYAVQAAAAKLARANLLQVEQDLWILTLAPAQCRT